MSKINAQTLLIASRDLDDANFERSVVLIIEHNEEHTIGLVLNRPLLVTCAEIVRQFELDWHGQDQHILRGGPVDSNMLWILHSDGWPFEHNVIFEGLGLSVTREALSMLCQMESERVKLFSGYAGWGPGQLHQELEEGAWMTAPASARFIFETDPDEMWEQALANLGIDAQLLMSSNGLVH